MRIHLPLFAAAALALSISPAVSAAPTQPSQAELARDYEQVRRVALKNPKVREAFDRANRILDDKIIELDPALRAYVRSGRAGGFYQAQRTGEPARIVPARTAHRPSAPAKPASAPASPGHRGRRQTHVVASGETLGGIANRYKVRVADLKTANRIADERRLKVGQVLVLPSGAKSQPAHYASRRNTAPAPAEKPGLWDRLKSGF